MDPATLLRLSTLMQQLGPDKLMRMQTLMHNLAAGHDVRAELAEFERQLPAGFREELLKIMATDPASFAAMGAGMGGGMGGLFGGAPPEQRPITPPGAASNDPIELPKDDREARLVILRAVADGRMSPEDAEPLLR
jgi:hypothetical protein